MLGDRAAVRSAIGRTLEHTSNATLDSMSQRSPIGTRRMGLNCVSIRFWTGCDKAERPSVAVRMGTGFSESEVWAAIDAGTRSRRNSAMPDRALPRRRRNAVFLLDTTLEPQLTLEGIVLSVSGRGEHHGGNLRIP